MAKYYIGTAGWSYKDWVPSFYPYKQSAGFDWLEFYSQWFNCVEVNATYYTYLPKKTAELWVRKVGEAKDFLFTIKLHQDFTHKRKFDSSNIKAFDELISVLALNDKLGGILIQFPYSFPFNNAASEYIRKLSNLFSPHKQFIEIRHTSWNTVEALALRDELPHTSICTIDQPIVGQAIPFEPIVANGIAYLRLHGRNVKAWKESLSNFGREQSYDQQNERYKYFYSPGELNEIAGKIKEIESKAKEIFVIMNNHPVGYAPANAFELIHFLENKAKVAMPETITTAFERLRIMING